MPSIPQSLAEITPQWLTSALRWSGVLDQGAVASCIVEPIGEESGFASRVGRIELTYDSADCPAPSSAIVKLSTSDPDQQRTDVLHEKYIREAAFYSDIAPEAGIHVPRCYYVSYQPDSASFVLLLEDLSEGRFGDVAKGWAIRDAELVVDSLAALHARWWDDPRLGGFKWLPGFASTISQQLDRLVGRREVFLRRHGRALPREVEELTARIGPQHASLFQQLEGPPETLLHVDTHLDNLVFLEDGDDSQLVVFDWQGVSRGRCVVDLALFLSGVSPELRRKHEADLIDRYQQRLIGRGVGTYPREQFSADYRVAMLRWWVGTVNGLGSAYADSWTGRQLDVARQSVERLTAAVLDHRLSDLV